MEIRNKEALAGQGEGRLGAAVFDALGCLCEACSCLRTGRWLLRTRSRISEAQRPPIHPPTFANFVCSGKAGYQITNWVTLEAFSSGVAVRK